MNKKEINSDLGAKSCICSEYMSVHFSILVIII